MLFMVVLHSLIPHKEGLITLHAKVPDRIGILFWVAFSDFSLEDGMNPIASCYHFFFFFFLKMTFYIRFVWY